MPPLSLTAKLSGFAMRRLALLGLSVSLLLTLPGCGRNRNAPAPPPAPPATTTQPDEESVSALEAARRIRCAENLRQIGQALAEYARMEKTGYPCLAPTTQPAGLSPDGVASGSLCSYSYSYKVPPTTQPDVSAILRRMDALSPDKAVLIVLVDTSASMACPDAPTTRPDVTTLEAVRRLLVAKDVLMYRVAVGENRLDRLTTMPDDAIPHVLLLTDGSPTTQPAEH
ncbi:MAG: hypothetical protein BIFFINMI_01821 [Phycisphaerae bacterium]|nr:hypothetical protein [Phycisphaerae bacterium]